MQFQFDLTTTQQAKPVAPIPTGPDAVPELLRQLLDLHREGFTQVLEVQREHLAHARAVHQENLQRWKNVMAKWAEEFPRLAAQAKRVYPLLERAYLGLLDNMVQDLKEQGDEGFESEFALQDFIDRHGMRVGQLGHMLGVIGPLSEAGPPPEQAPGTGA